MKDFLSRLLDFYSLTEEEYKNYTRPLSLFDFPDYHKFDGIKEIAKTIKEYAKTKKILVYGDYDCDGIMSTVIMVKTLRELGANPGYYIPRRDLDGYGLTNEKIDEFKALNYEVIILVDNGITLNDQIDHLNSLGMEAIIVDHHTPSDTLPNAKHIMHYKVSGFGDINMSAGATCFYLSQSILGRFDEYLCALGTLSLLSDVMPLISYNRDFVRIGLEIINRNKYPQIVKLIGQMDHITEKDLSFSLIPKINAVLRIELNNKLYRVPKYFLEDDLSTLDKLAQYFEKIYLEKKAIVEEEVSQIKTDDSDTANFVEIHSNEGIIGEVANRLLSNNDKPSLVYIKNHENSYKGSMRSHINFNCHEFLKANEDLLIRYGGHANAAGLEFSEEAKDKLKAQLNGATKHMAKEDDSSNYVEISINDINAENYRILKTFEPFGNGNPLPKFILKHFKTETFQYSRDGKHILTPLTFSSKLVYFSFDKDILAHNFVDLIGTFDVNVFRDVTTYQLTVKDFKVSNN